MYQATATTAEPSHQDDDYGGGRGSSIRSTSSSSRHHQQHNQPLSAEDGAPVTDYRELTYHNSLDDRHSQHSHTSASVSVGSERLSVSERLSLPMRRQGTVERTLQQQQQQYQLHDNNNHDNDNTTATPLMMPRSSSGSGTGIAGTGNDGNSSSSSAHHPPLLEIPEEVYAVRKSALQVLKPLTRSWVRC